MEFTGLEINKAWVFAGPRTRVCVEHTSGPRAVHTAQRSSGNLMAHTIRANLIFACKRAPNVLKNSSVQTERDYNGR